MHCQGLKTTRAKRAAHAGTKIIFRSLRIVYHLLFFSETNLKVRQPLMETLVFFDEEKHYEKFDGKVTPTDGILSTKFHENWKDAPENAFKNFKGNKKVTMENH